MDSPEPLLVNSSPNIVSPNDCVVIDDNPPILNKLDDLGMKVANNFKTNLHRGLNDTIKQRKFFKRVNGNVEEVDSNGVDVSKVLKLISKPVSEVFALKTPPKCALKTYTNKRKHVSESDGFILESFGLPDEPIVPLHKPVVIKRDKNIDVDDFNTESNAVMLSFGDLPQNVDSEILQPYTDENSKTEMRGNGQVKQQINVVKKKRKFVAALQNLPKRVLRSSIENNNGDFSVNNKNKVINPVKLALQIERNSNQTVEDVDLVINPCNIQLKSLEAKNNLQIEQKPEVTETDNEIEIFQVGTLAWAKIGTHPYWPCMITEEPTLGKHWKYMTNRVRPYYHVQFFGDRGRRSWVFGGHVMPYTGKNDLERKAEELKADKKMKMSLIKESYVIHPRNLNKWESGVDEAESLKDKTLEERLNYFIKASFVANEKPRKTEESAKNEDDLAVVQNTTSSLTEEQKEVDDTFEMVSKKLKKFQKKEEFSEKSLKARKKLRTLHVTNHSVKKPEVNSSEEVEQNLPTPPKNRKQAEHSSSDTDSKFSDNSSVPTSLESQAALHRRNNIFRGISREKVCQICEKPGEVFKCKGPCNGVYHYTCGNTRTIEEIPEKEIKEVTVSSPNLVDSPKPLDSPKSSQTLPPNYKDMTLPEKIDFRMKEIMKKFEHQTLYADSTDSSSLDESFREASPKAITSNPIVTHVTADCVWVSSEVRNDKDNVDIIAKNPRCVWCASDDTPLCLVCNQEKSKTGDSFRQKCSLHQCGKFYHPECLRAWPQTQWCLVDSTKDTFVCPHHVCHTCISDDPHTLNSRCPSDKGVKCLRCPSNYHASNYCVPAGSEILSSSQILCPRHFTNSRRNFQQTINTNWCFICSEGGNLICCETCPTSVHAECLPGDLDKDETFYCEDCQSGRLPLYDEIVWVKLGTFRWWPALILFPNEVPENVRNVAHSKGEFVVKFFGTYNHNWVGRGRTFLFQEDDNTHPNKIKKRVDSTFAKAILEAAAAHQLKKQFKLNKVAKKTSGFKPPPYIRIKVNKPVGNVRHFDGNTSNTTSCGCDPNQPHPCGPDSDCLNRLLLTECNPMVCPAGNRCKNQCFEKREYPPLVPHRTEVRGWGLKTLAPIRKGQFVIEYVGEIIDEQEYQRRLQKMHQQKEENYYFLTIDKDRMIDAGPKGNVARFMNHSCQPNCETQKWTVNGHTRVGLFAKNDIPADTELTFNYNLECTGKEKKICQCGAPNCSGYIGVKVKTDDNRKKSNKPKRKKPTRPPPPPDPVIKPTPCFVCGEDGDVGACNNKMCTKFYHLGCVGLTTWPEGGKWVCSWHNCNFCSKRTSRCCVKCVNSYCPSHSQGLVRYDKVMGFVCSEHDPLTSSKQEEISNEVSQVLETSQDVSLEQKDISQSEITTTSTNTVSSVSIRKRKKAKRRITKWGNRKRKAKNTANSI